MIRGFIFLTFRISIKRFVVLSFFFLPFVSAAEDGMSSDFDPSMNEFYLITVDVGSQVWDNFGHSALRIINEKTGSDLTYNWGVFDASEGWARFGLDFFLGEMNYQLVAQETFRELNLYKRQGRSVWQERINLNNNQKQRLYNMIEENLKSENRSYKYHYFFKNCTTVIRDYLDEVFDGGLQSKIFGNVDRTFRDEIREHYASQQLVSFSLDVLMNKNVDRQMTQWESLFLPGELRRALSGVASNVGVDGVRLPLLSQSESLLSFSSPTKESNPYQLIFWLLLLPSLGLGVCVRRNQQIYFGRDAQLGLRYEKVSFRVLGLIGAVVSIFSGVYGAVMLGGWFFSSHADLFGNINLLLFWPTDLVGFVIAMKWLFTSKAWSINHNTAPFVMFYWLAHWFGLLVYLMIWISSLGLQETSPIIFYLLPGLFVFTAVVWLVGFVRVQTRSYLQ